MKDKEGKNVIRIGRLCFEIEGRLKEYYRQLVTELLQMFNIDNENIVKEIIYKTNIDKKFKDFAEVVAKDSLDHVIWEIKEIESKRKAYDKG